MKMLVSIASPQVGEILPLCNCFFDCPVLSLLFFSILRPRRTAGQILRFIAKTTCIHARMVVLEVRTMRDVIWGKYMSLNLFPPKKNKRA